MATTKAASLAGSLVEQFSERIRVGDMPPGTRMPSEKDIAASAGVSRTVVREALARLAASGLVQSRQGAGAFVAETARYSAFQVTREELEEVEDVIKLLEMRLALETEMASLAAARRTDDDIARMAECLRIMAETDDPEVSAEADAAFHSAIADATSNEYYARFMQFLGVRLVPSRKLSLSSSQSSETLRDYTDLIGRDHKAIFDAIVARDPHRASLAARHHMMQSLQRHARLRDERALGALKADAVADAEPSAGQARKQIRTIHVGD